MKDFFIEAERKNKKSKQNKILRNLKSEAELKKLEFANCDEIFTR